MKSKRPLMQTPKEAFDRLTSSMMANNVVTVITTPVESSGPYDLVLFSPNPSLSESERELFKLHGFRWENLSYSIHPSELIGNPRRLMYKHEVKLHFMPEE